MRTAVLDHRFMALALAEGQRGLGLTWPNPAVGCVLVKNSRILARAHTQLGGRPHAEALALQKAGAQAQGATAYVTLEPCAHHGQTPPCADALIQAGIARVVISNTDPDPRVAGKGVALLQNAGIDVTQSVMECEGHRLNEGFFCKITKARPHITLKLASSLDGRIATKTGESRWITGPASRQWVHRMRATSDAVMIGSGTALADDPMLDVRPIGPKPVRIVLDRSLKLPPTSRLAQTAQDHPVWLMHATTPSATLEHAGVELIETPQANGRLDLSQALRLLGERGMTRVFCEGGGTLAASLMQEGLVDRLITFTAGLGLGSDGIPSLGKLSYNTLATAPHFTLEETRAIGNDVMMSWIPNA